jgi:hypothetical protein
VSTKRSAQSIGDLSDTDRVLVGLALATSAQQPPPEDPPPQHVWIETPPEAMNDWPRHFRLGALVGINTKYQNARQGQGDAADHDRASRPHPDRTAGDRAEDLETSRLTDML